MSDENIHVYESISDKPVLIKVATSDNWSDAIDAAAKCRVAEIGVYGRNPDDCLVVYSDLSYVNSGLWWREAIATRRRELGI